MFYSDFSQRHEEICYHIVEKHFFWNDKLSFRNGLEYFEVEWILIFHIWCKCSRSCTQLRQFSKAPTYKTANNRAKIDDPGSNSILGSTFATETSSNFIRVRSTTDHKHSSNQRSFFISILEQKIVCNNSLDWLIWLQNIMMGCPSVEKCVWSCGRLIHYSCIQNHDISIIILINDP